MSMPSRPWTRVGLCCRLRRPRSARVLGSAPLPWCCGLCCYVMGRCSAGPSSGMASLLPHQIPPRYLSYHPRHGIRDAISGCGISVPQIIYPGMSSVMSSWIHLGMHTARAYALSVRMHLYYGDTPIHIDNAALVMCDVSPTCDPHPWTTETSHLRSSGSGVWVRSHVSHPSLAVFHSRRG